MTPVSPRRIAIALGIVLIPVALCGVNFIATRRARLDRDAKAAELDRIALGYWTTPPDLAVVLRELGKPGLIHGHDKGLVGSPGPGTKELASGRQFWTYRFEYRAFPWSTPFTTSLHVILDCQSGNCSRWKVARTGPLIVS
jgi:hypothetical protein